MKYPTSAERALHEVSMELELGTLVLEARIAELLQSAGIMQEIGHEDPGVYDVNAVSD